MYLVGFYYKNTIYLFITTRWDEFHQKISFVSSSVQGSLAYCLFLDVPHEQHGRMSSDMSNEEAIFPCLLSPKHSHSTVLLKNRSVFENSARKCVSQRCGLMVSDRTMGSIILAETYSIPTLTSCNGTAWVNMGFVADQYLLGGFVGFSQYTAYF